MSRGSMTSSGSKGIRNFLGGKFQKRAASISKAADKKSAPGFMVPGQSKAFGGGAAKGQDFDSTILEDMDSDIDGDLSEDACNYNYDVIGLKEPTNPFHNEVKNVLTAYYRRLGDENDSENDPVSILQSSTLLAVEIQIYMKLGSEPQDSIFVLANDVAIFLYKQRKNIVVTPFKILDIKELVIAENVPSACTMQVDESVEDKIGRSHLIFESKSMGLILRYVLERNYEEIEVDFSDSVPIREQGVEKDFCFTDLDAIR